MLGGVAVLNRVHPLQSLAGGAPRALLSQPDARLRWDVLEEHFEEACFLLGQWEWAHVSARLTLAGVVRGPERRLRAHLEGLAFGGPEVAARLVRPWLTDEDGARSTVAALALLAQPEDEGVAAVLALLRSGEAAQQAAMARALALSGRPELSTALMALLNAEAAPEVLALGLEALRMRGDAPGPFNAALLVRLRAHHAPEVRRAFLHAAAWHPAAGPVDLGLYGQGTPPEVRASALRVGVAQGQREAWRACLEALEAPDAPGRMARFLVALSGERGAVARLTALLHRPALRADTLWALGFSGRIAAVEACLPWLGDADVGALAAEAFCAVTGLPLMDAYVRPREETDADDVPPEEVSSPLWPGRDADLPLPDAAALARWWAGARGDFEDGTRYLGGRPFTAAGLVEALESVPMRRRGPLALELAVRSAGALAVEPRTWARVQLHQLQAARDGLGRVRLHPFTP
jgi:uncharacterized protein (TIGR02270 family)